MANDWQRKQLQSSVMVSNVLGQIRGSSLCHTQARHSSEVAKIYYLKTMRRRLETQRTCRIRWDQIRRHLACFGSRLSVVREFATRKDPERLQSRRPTFSQAPRNCRCVHEEVIIHPSLFFRRLQVLLFESQDKGRVPVGQPRFI